MVWANSSVPGSGGHGLNLVAFERFVLGLACTDVLVVDRQLWGEMPKDHGMGYLPSASLARLRLVSLNFLRLGEKVGPFCLRLSVT